MWVYTVGLTSLRSSSAWHHWKVDVAWHGPVKPVQNVGTWLVHMALWTRAFDTDRSESMLGQYVCYGKWYHRCPVGCNKLVFHYPKVRCCHFLGRIHHFPSGWVVAHGLSSVLQFCNDHWARTAVQPVCEFSAISVIPLLVKYHDHPWSQCCQSVQDDARCRPRLQEQRCTRKKCSRTVLRQIGLDLRYSQARRWQNCNFHLKFATSHVPVKHVTTSLCQIQQPQSLPKCFCSKRFVGQTGPGLASSMGWSHFDFVISICSEFGLNVEHSKIAIASRISSLECGTPTWKKS